MADPAPVGAIYRLRVVLRGISPLIWRRLEVPASTTVAGLHQVLQLAFGWSGEHLHQFSVHARDYGISACGGPGFHDDPDQHRIAQWRLRCGERFVYDYDLAIPWPHDLRLEAIRPGRPGQRTPRCTGGARTGPPEDCGGPQAFLALRAEHPPALVAARIAEILTDVLDLDHPIDPDRRLNLGERRAELAELLRWARVDAFDRAGLNQALTTLPRGEPS